MWKSKDVEKEMRGRRQYKEEERGEEKRKKWKDVSRDRVGGVQRDREIDIDT